MKKLILFSIVLLFSYASFAQWEAVQTPSGKTITTLFANDNLYAGSTDGVYQYLENEWSKIGSSDLSKYVYCITEHNGYILAGTDLGIYRSSNGGNSWTRVLSTLDTYSISVYNDILIACTSLGTQISVDNGSNWNLKTFDTYIKSIILGDTLILISNKDVIMSIDSLKSGTNISLGIKPKQIMDITFADSTLYLATIDSGIYKSTNFGKSWTKQNKALRNLSVKSIHYINDTLYCATNDSLYIAADTAKIKWKTISDAPLKINSIATWNNSIVTGNYFGANIKAQNKFSSLNDGFPKLQIKNIFDVLDTCYLSTEKGVFIFDKNQQPTTRFSNLHINDFININDSVYYIINDYGLFKSADALQNWEHIYYQKGVHTAIESNGFLFIGTEDDAVLKTVVDENNFMPSNNGIKSGTINKIFKSDTALIAVCDEYAKEGIYLSKDNGENWTKLNVFDDKGFYSYAVINSTIITGTGWDVGFYGMITSYNITTEEVNTSSANIIIPGIRGSVETIAGTQTPTKFGVIGNTIYASTSSNQIMYSNNSGETWAHYGNGLPNTNNNDLMQNIYATKNMLYFTTLDSDGYLKVYSRPLVTNEFDLQASSLSSKYSINNTNENNIDLVFSWEDNSGSNNSYFVCVEETAYERSFLMALKQTEVGENSIDIKDNPPTYLDKNFYLVKANGKDYWSPVAFETPVLTSLPLSELNEIRAYPNPFNEQLKLINNSKVSNRTVTIFDPKGSCILIRSMFNENEIIDTKGWTSGVYLFKITDNETGKFKASKFIKE